MSNVKLDSGHSVVPVTGKEEEQQKRLFKGYKYGTIRLQPGGWYFTSFFPKFANALYNFEFKPTDVVIMTFPRSGTTWTQEIVWTMQNNPNLDNPDARLPINTRVPFIEMDYLVEPEEFKELSRMIAKYSNFPESVIDDGLSMYSVKHLSDPRTIKTHLPFSLLPLNLSSTSKIIYVVRNPKAVCLSYFHLSKLFLPHDFEGSFDEFLELFINDELVFGPYFPQLMEAWDQRNKENILFLFYEKMKSDPQLEYQRINEFLKTDLSENQISNIVAYSNFSQMKERDNYYNTNEINSPIVNTDVLKSRGGFFRKGEATDWKLQFTKEQDDKMNRWIAEHIKGTELTFE